MSNLIPCACADDCIHPDHRSLPLDLTPQLARLQARVQYLENRVTVDALAFDLIKMHPGRAVTIATEALDQIRRGER